MTLNRAFTLAVARETAKRSQRVLDTSQQTAMAVSTYKRGLNKIVVPPDCCNNCGNKKNSDRSDCPAIDFVCSCGKQGRFKKYCFQGGKKRGGGEAGKKTTSKEESDSKEETGHGIGEHCFSLQAEGETSRGLGFSTGPLKSQLPVFTEPDEVTLAILWSTAVGATSG